jgi:hypothetical protein
LGRSGILTGSLSAAASLRRHGLFFRPQSQQATIAAAAEREALDGWQVPSGHSFATLVRAEGLAGAVNYTEPWQPSPDERVKAPLGVLWFDDSVGFFKRSPPPMFVDGVMRAYDKLWKGYPDGDRPPYKLDDPTYVDVYTGRELAGAEIPPADARFPAFDADAVQPSQYRPPTQLNAWSPAPPVAGQRINPMTGEAGAAGVSEKLRLRRRLRLRADLHRAVRHSGVLRQAIGKRDDSHQRSAFRMHQQHRAGLRIAECALLLRRLHLQLPAAQRAVADQYAGDARAVEYLGPGGRPAGDGHPACGHQSGRPRRPDDAGRYALAGSPSVGGPSPVVTVRTEPAEPSLFYRHSLFLQGGRGWPWVGASGAEGLSRLTVEGLEPGSYTVRLYLRRTRVRRGRRARLRRAVARPGGARRL